MADKQRNDNAADLNADAADQNAAVPDVNAALPTVPGAPVVPSVVPQENPPGNPQPNLVAPNQGQQLPLLPPRPDNK